MNTLTIDENAPVVAGRYGVKPNPTQRPEVGLENFRDSLAAPVVLPPSFSVTKGVTKGLNMLGNNEEGDCVVAATQHARMFKALVSFENGVMTFEKGFRPPHAPYALTLYWAFGISQGEPGPRPDDGCDPAAWFAWFYRQGLCDAFGQPQWEVNVDNTWQADLLEVKKAIVQWNGVCASFVLPRQFEGQFNVVPFTYQPGDQMTKDGHEMFITGYDDATQLFEVCTWGIIWHATYEFVQYLMTSCFVFVSKEDAENANVNFDALEAACAALPGGEGNAPVDAVAGGGIFGEAKHDIESFVSEKHLHDIAEQGKKIVTMALNREAVNLVLHEIVVLLQIAIKDDLV